MRFQGSSIGFTYGLLTCIDHAPRLRSFYIARDPIGVTCLYIGWGRDGSIWAASEMKCLKDDCARFQQFPPGGCACLRPGRMGVGPCRSRG